MVKNRGWQLLSLLIVAALLLAACGGAATEEPTQAPETTVEETTAEETADETAEETAAPDEGPAKFAVITSGPRDDNSWNEAAYNGSEALTALGYETAFSERIAEGDELRILREYADQGFDLIVAHGFGYQDGVFEVAAEYPEINFAWAGGINRTAANVGDYDQPFYEAAYGVGVVAGHMSESGVLGSLVGFDIPVCHAMAMAFLAGARTVNPDVRLINTAAGSWEDVAAAKEAALAQAEAGVDFWIECGEGPALGAIEAAKEAGGWVTGYVGDMSENGPDVVLTSLVWTLEPLFSTMMEQTVDGTFDNPFYKLGVADGSLLLVYNEALKDQIPAEALADADAAMAAITAGDIVVPFVPEGDLPAESGAEGPTELNVAAILSIGLESTWDSTFYEAFQRVQALKPHGVTIGDLDFTEGAWGDEAETVLRQYAETGKYDIIFAQASFTDQIKNLMDEFPDIAWVVSGSGNEQLGGNLYNIYMRIHEPSYLEGMLAGLMTESNVIGVLGLFPADDVNDDANAFIAGAKAVNPEVQAKVTFIETWYDPALATEATKAMIAAGADHILQGGEVYDVCTEAGIYCYARYADSNFMAPDSVLSSAIGYWDPAILYIIDEWWKHETTGEPYDAPQEKIWFPMSEGAADLAPFHGLDSQVPQEVKDEVMAMRQQILDGTFEVPLNEETPQSD
jgi:simple sugar transport system substrate-binding protein/basic membrane protein A